MDTPASIGRRYVRQSVVLFRCIHNSGRSLAAKVLLENHAGDRVGVHSAGSEPAEHLNQSVVAVFEERGSIRVESSRRG